MRLVAGMMAAVLTMSAPPSAFAAPVVPESAWRVAARALSRDKLKHPAWGYSHSLRDYRLAKTMAATDHVAVDDDVLFAAAMLHDMAGFAPWEDKTRDHSDVAADIVPKLLTEWGFPATKIPAVQAAIRTHMYYRDPVGAEARYIHDADAIDWLGAIGVFRIAALADPAGGKPDGPRVVALMEDNLAKVPGRIVTPAGKALIAVRKAELEKFLKDLRAETENLGDL